MIEDAGIIDPTKRLVIFIKCAGIAIALYLALLGMGAI